MRYTSTLNDYYLAYICVYFYFFRIQTLIHFIAYIGTEAMVIRKVNKHSLAMITEVNEENVSFFFVCLYDCCFFSRFSLPNLLMPQNDLMFLYVC